MELFDAGEYVVAIGHNVGYFKATGETFSVRAVHTWRFSNGRIADFASYLDADSALGQIKLTA